MNDGRGGLWPDVYPAGQPEDLVDMVRRFTEIIAEANVVLSGPQSDLVGGYLRWVATTRASLRAWWRPADVDRVLLTDTYWRLARDPFGPNFAHMRTELEDASGRVAEMEVDFVTFWNAWRDVRVVIPDTNVLMSDAPFDTLDWHQLAQVDPAQPITLLIVQIVIDELDRQKDRGEQKPRVRARTALQRIEALLLGDPEIPVMVGSQTRVRMIGEDPKRSTWPRDDDELVDCAERFRFITASPATIVSNDTGMITRCYHRGVRAVRASPLTR